jgi:hypothetical protein
VSYDLVKFGEWQLMAKVRMGVRIECPNCGLPYYAQFKNPIGGCLPESFSRNVYTRTGEELSNLTVNQVIPFVDHAQLWIRDGRICVEGEFKCKMVVRKVS